MPAPQGTHLAAGASLRRRHPQPDVRHDVQTVDWIIQSAPAVPLWNFARCRAPPGRNASWACRGPVRICWKESPGGTPREYLRQESWSGGRARRCRYAGCCSRRQARDQAALGRRPLVAASATIDFAALGAAYLERTRPRTGHTPRWVDKMRWPILAAGLIHARLLKTPSCTSPVIRWRPATPSSRRSSTRAIRSRTTWRSSPNTISGYHRLMSHWRRVMPQTIFDVSYEKLVTSPATEASRCSTTAVLPGVRIASTSGSAAPASTTDQSRSGSRFDLLVVGGFVA